MNRRSALALTLQHIRKGSLRPLAVSSAKRTPLIIEVPTVAETGMGLEGFEVLGCSRSSRPPRRLRRSCGSSTRS